MTQPTAFTRLVDYTDDATNNVGGRTTVRADKLDAEFDALVTTLTTLLANLALLQRDDTELKDGTVKLHTLATDIRALLTAAGATFNAAGTAWLTATAYAAKNLVTQAGATYFCVTAHTSGVFATDLAANKWILIANSPSAFVASSITNTPSGGIAATDVQTALNELDTEKLAKASNLSDVASVATARLNLGENASGSAFTRKHDFAATAAPTVTDDTSAGYAIGSTWYDLTNDKFWTCVDATAAAAVWRGIGADPGPAFKNRLINGDVRIDQRNGGAAVTVNALAFFYGPDMWRGVGETADGVFTIRRSTSSPPLGFTHFLRATVTTADASIGAAQSYRVVTPIEGSNAADLGFGAAGAQTVTLSFRVRSSLAGTFSGSLANAAGNRTHPFSYTISAANTWETKAVAIPGDVTGTWPTDSSVWGSVVLDLGSGTSVRGPAGAWAGTNYVGVTGAVSLIATNGATLDFASAQLEPGASATEFERVDFGTQLNRCERYFEKTFEANTVPAQNVGSFAGALRATGQVLNTRFITWWPFKTHKRAAPTIVTFSPNAASANWITNGTTPTAQVMVSGETGIGVAGMTDITAGIDYTIHATASAEL